MKEMKKYALITRKRFKLMLKKTKLFLHIALLAILSHQGFAEAIVADKIYGMPWWSNGLANTSMRYVDSSYRIRAIYTGQVHQFKWYNKWTAEDSGYSKGTGGIISIELRSDDGSAEHLPSDTVLASVVVEDPHFTGQSRADQLFPTVTFNQAVSVVAGELYHIVFRNIHPDRQNNFVSINCIFHTDSTSPRQPGIDDLSLSHYYWWNGQWVLRDRYTPIYQLNYTDGRTQGMGYMEVWQYHNGAKPIGGMEKVRQTFTVNGQDHIVSKLTVRLRLNSGSSPLIYTLKKISGEILEQGTIPASEISSDYDWVTQDLQSRQTLEAGESYYLEFSTLPSNAYEIFPLRDGSGQYGFSEETVFSDGYAQHTESGAWHPGWYYLSRGSRKDADLQFYFTLADDLSQRFAPPTNLRLVN